MSSVYATEPATSGRVIFETTHGPLQVDLWCRECPRTTRLFLQLCCDGFYDNALFHRIVPNFLIQTGAMRLRENVVESIDWNATSQTLRDIDDPSNKTDYREMVQASLALERRKYEWNSRIQFNHRGQVAMALEIDQDDDDNYTLQPQFFITLEEAEYLNEKHLIFGTITGPTLFNAIRIGQVHVEEDRVQESPRITSVRIVENTIHTDLVPLPFVPWQQKQKAAAIANEMKRKKRKGKLDTNVLSFGDELEDEGEEQDGLRIMIRNKMKTSKKSSHVVDHENQKQSDNRKNHQEQQSTKEAAILGDSVTKVEPATAGAGAKGASNSKQLEHHDSDKEDSYTRETSKTQPARRRQPPQQQQQQQEKDSSRVTSIVEARKAKYGKTKKTKRDREDDTLAKLQAFQSKVKKVVHGAGENSHNKQNRFLADNSLAARMARRAGMHVDEGNAIGDAHEDQEAPVYHGQVLDNDEDEQNDKVASSSSWMKTTFKCRRHMDLLHSDLGGDGRDADDYKVIDDRERSNRDEKHRSNRHHDREKHHQRYETEHRHRSHHR